MNEHDESSEEGGESACYAHLLCLECGVVLSDGHAVGCSHADPPPS